MTVRILGTIVSPDYDDDIFASWIDRGIITPSSRVVSTVESADEPFDLYINSYGGDVFAGGEMQIALVKAAASGKIRKCEVGSIAASMAANIVAALRANGVDVEGHVNSQLMFHGCYTVTDGGAQHHEDVAESLRNINECVIANLRRCGVEECRAWFAEGREKWLPCDECRKLNLFTSTAETDASAPAEAKQTAARLAAFASSVMSRKDYKMEIDTTIKAEEVKPDEAAPVADTAETPTDAAPAVNESKPADEDSSDETHNSEVTVVTDEAFEARVSEAANKRFAGLQAKHDQMISDLKANIASLTESLASVSSERDQLKAERETLIASHAEELASVRAQLDAEKSAHEATVTGVLKPESKNECGWREKFIAARSVSNVY